LDVFSKFALQHVWHLKLASASKPSGPT